MSPDEVLEKHTSYRLAEWMAYFQADAIIQKQAANTQKLQADVAAKRKGRR